MTKSYFSEGSGIPTTSPWWLSDLLISQVIESDFARLEAETTSAEEASKKELSPLGKAWESPDCFFVGMDFKMFLWDLSGFKTCLWDLSGFQWISYV